MRKTGLNFDLETGRLHIRCFQDSDLESFLAYRNDPEVARYQGWDVPYPREMALDFVEEMKTKDPFARGQWFQAALEENDTGEVIGDVAYYLKKDDPQAYIGFTIAHRYWRKGYGREAVQCLLSYLFDQFDLHRVIAITDVDNVASFSLLECLGFRREAHFVENLMFKGHWASEYYYALLKREWQNIGRFPGRDDLPASGF
jgi:RimJ/RimL family protein N-acetyltransferase